MNDDLDEKALKGGSAGRLIVIALSLGLLLVAGAGAMYYFSEPEMDPTRVLVVRMGGVHEHFDDPFVDAFAARLTEHGFDVVVHETPLGGEQGEADATAAVRALAHEARAGSVVLLVIGAENERAGVLAGQHLFRTHLASLVVPTDPAADVISHRSEFAFEGSSALDVASNVQVTWLDTMVPDTIDALYAVPSILEIAEARKDLEMSRMRFVIEIRDKLRMVEARRERAHAFRQSCVLAREEVTSIASSENGVRCLGDPCHPWSAIGLSLDGQTAYVHEHYREPIFEMLDSGETRWTEPPEAVIAVPLDGSPQRSLLRVGHFYGLAQVRPDLTSLSAAFFGNGVPVVVTLDPNTGDWQQRWLLSGRERVTWKAASPDGASALVYRREEGWGLLGADQPIVMPNFDEAAVVRFPDDVVRIVGVLETGELTVVGLDAAPEEVAIPLPGRIDEVIEGPRDDTVDLLMHEGRQCSLIHFTLSSRTTSEPIPLPTCLDDAITLADGRLLGAAVWSSRDDAPGDLEIVVVDPSTGGVVGITRNTLRDELPFANQAGDQLVFSREVGEWPAGYDLELYRRVLCTAAIPPR